MKTSCIRTAALGVALAVSCLAAATGSRVLYEKDSAYSHIVVTEDAHGLRSLLFEKDGALQSVVKVGDPNHIELPYARSMFVGLAFAEKPQRVLIVGLGGGTLPRFLHANYPNMSIDVVDIDPDVAKVAKKYFGFREDKRMRVHIRDGRKFIEECKKPYDLILLDAFSAENIPYHLATREFLEAVRRAVNKKGAVVANVWSLYSNPLYDDMLRTYQEVFQDLYVFDVKDSGNRIFVAIQRKEKVRKKKLARRAREISTKGGFRFDLGETVLYGFQHPEKPHASGKILTDKGAAGTP